MYFNAKEISFVEQYTSYNFSCSNAYKRPKHVAQPDRPLMTTQYGAEDFSFMPDL
jgi:hypothetical protein